MLLWRCLPEEPFPAGLFSQQLELCSMSPPSPQGIRALLLDKINGLNQELGFTQAHGVGARLTTKYASQVGALPLPPVTDGPGLL